MTSKYDHNKIFMCRHALCVSAHVCTYQAADRISPDYILTVYRLVTFPYNFAPTVSAVPSASRGGAYVQFEASQELAEPPLADCSAAILWFQQSGGE